MVFLNNDANDMNQTSATKERISDNILHQQLSHWGRDKMAAILKTTIWNPFCCMNVVVLDIRLTEIQSQASK